jgi:hypothetical protein
MKGPLPAFAALSFCYFAAIGLFTIGCDSTGGRIHSYRLNPSPEVDTLSESHEEIENAVTVAYDYNLRALNQDVGRFWMTDRPSRLTRFELNH